MFCENCELKRASSFIEDRHVCSVCFVIYKFKEHPITLQHRLKDVFNEKLPPFFIKQLIKELKWLTFAFNKLFYECCSRILYYII